MWVTKLTTTNRAEHAGRWLCSLWSLGPGGTSRGGEGEGKHHWASAANREPTCSVHHFGGGRAFTERFVEGPLGVRKRGGKGRSREGAGEVEATGAH
jgi:hypothetical protein